jgi:hypothetical protein
LEGLSDLESSTHELDVVHFLDSSSSFILISELDEAISLVQDDIGTESRVVSFLEELKKLIESA